MKFTYNVRLPHRVGVVDRK